MRYPDLVPADTPGRGKGNDVFHAIAEALRRIGGALGTLVALPFRALARLFGAASGSGGGGARRA
ncbi:hypothetical protein BX257_7599 [Streptomyces sp. 3212.3]|nr:hypothetical protein BX257_7599 [Streptomyces sp. 3212.3]